MDRKKTGLIILDGWGYGEANDRNAIHVANTPFVDHLHANYPHAELRTDGENVGLPAGQMGNSEVGHMNIGAGRIVYQDFLRINKSIESGDFQTKPEIQALMDRVTSGNGRLHLMGLVSDGGVHSHQNHLFALLNIAKANGIKEVYVHAFTDGRDTDPKSGEASIALLEQTLEQTGGALATITGRYYAMDRDQRWERIAKAYNAMIHGQGAQADSGVKAVQASYAAGTTDEFLEPIVLDLPQGRNGRIKAGDEVLCFNFRTDRCRQITRALTQEQFPDHGMSTLDVGYSTMTVYDESFKGVNVIFDKADMSDTLGETIAKAGKTQLRLAETEKYPHVTFFFNGGREECFDGEHRKMAQSPKVATYDLQPEMSANDLVGIIHEAMDSMDPDFFCLNFANPDMVGHTGVFSAVVKAVETTDACLKQVVEKALEKGYSLVVIADHGNADKALNSDGSPNTAHTTNPVPIIVLDKEVDHVSNGVLADVAPTLLKMMNLPQPVAMTGSSLV